jgi:hypothetical protein
MLQPGCSSAFQYLIIRELQFDFVFLSDGKVPSFLPVRRAFIIGISHPVGAHRDFGYHPSVLLNSA